MKPIAFEYHAPTSIAEVITLLQTLPDPRVLAGGQSLVPMLNFRAATPGHLIDLNNVPELAGIAQTEGGLRIGAMTRQRAVERSPLISLRCPLLKETIDHVGHQQTRNRGTIGGSLAHLDPGAELPIAAAVLEAIMTIRGPNGERTVPFREFPAGYLATVIEPDEILTHIDIPVSEPDQGYAFIEFNQRPADLLVVGVGVLLQLDGERVRSTRIAVGGVDYAPVRLDEVEALLTGRVFDEDAIAAATAGAAAIPCEGDEVSPPEFRQHLAGVLVGRALRKAAMRARGGST